MPFRVFFRALVGAKEPREMGMRESKRDLTFSLFTPAIALIALTTLLLAGIVYQVGTTDWIEGSDSVLLHVKDAEIAIRNAMLAAQSYTANPNSQSLSEFTQAGSALTKSLNNLDGRVVDNQQEAQRLREGINLERQWLTSVQVMFDQRKPAARAIFDRHTQAYDQAIQISRQLHGLADNEDRVRMARDLRKRQEEEFIFVAAIVLSFGLGAFLTYWGWRQVRDAKAQFALALERAEEAGRLKDNFIASVSHELRNPLNSIMLWCHAALGDEELGAKARRGLVGIDEAARAQAQLIDDLLDVSRMETGRLRLEIQPTDLSEVVKDVINNFRVTAQAKAIEITQDIGVRVGSIEGDRNRLQQIVSNLLSNAVKFAPPDGKVNVRLQRINSQVELTVADNGSGIDPEALTHVFERFWQNDRKNGKDRSFGLGLAIVKQLVALHGGTITAHSEGLGKGATFRVCLPSSTSNVSANAGGSLPTAVATATHCNPVATRLDDCSILFVDDDVNACDAMEELLNGLGATVTTATSADDALALLDEVRADVIVSDIGMPVHDGLWFARELRRRERRAHANQRTPLLALTAYGRVDDRFRVMQAGFDCHVVKPVELSELSAMIRRLLGAQDAFARPAHG